MVNNKTVKIIVITIIIIIIIAGGTIFLLVQPKETISPLSSKVVPTENTASLKLPSETLKDYKSDSGFNFQYPQDLNVSEKDAEDETLYADLELTSSQAKGSVFIKIMDTKLKSIDDWILENKIAVLSSKDIKIDSLSGRELKITNKLIAVSIDQGVLFTIEVNSKDSYWLSVYNTLISSFEFSQNQTVTIPEDTVLDATNNIILEEETVE